MRIQLSKIALAAGIGLAVAFTVSCSSDDDTGNEQSSSSSGTEISSPSGGGSSSSNGTRGSSSSAGNSSSSVPSSSSTGGSSSSVVQSSSSEVSSSSVSSSSSSNNIRYGPSVTHGGKTYKTLLIGSQSWMAENLNYNVAGSGSVCYDNIEANCDTYGRLYNWETAKTVCPIGWRLPSREDWDKLIRYVDGYNSPTAGRYLKAMSMGGEDTYGFKALLGGFSGRVDPGCDIFCSAGNSADVDNFADVDETGYWWSASEHSSTTTSVYNLEMYHDNEYASWSYSDKSYFYSVRCVQDLDWGF